MMHELIKRYLNDRRAVGYKMEKAEQLLNGFACFAERAGDTYVRSETAIAWAKTASTPEQRDNRLAYLRRCIRWLHAEDPRHELPPTGLFCPRRSLKRTPIILSDEEIRLMMTEALSLTARMNPLRPLLYWTLIGLLASTGLRISEALNLEIEDITPDGLHIRQTKFKKERLVPIDATVRAALDSYLSKRKEVNGLSPYLFVSHKMERLSYNTVLQTFLKMVKRLGLHASEGNSGVRLHDFRHTFAVRALENCAKTSGGVQTHMLALSTYLGHTCAANSYRYLHITPRILDDICDSYERLIKEDLR